MTRISLRLHNSMRTFFSLALLIGGLGLFMLDALAHALVNAPTLSFYQKQLQSFPVKETYSREELADAAWQVWTNRVSLPEQTAYTVADFKTALVGQLLGTQQDYCDRRLFEHGIGTVAGYPGRAEHGAGVVGLAATLFGAFLLGGVVFPAKRRQRSANRPKETPAAAPER